MSPLALVAVIPAAVIVLAAIEAPACAWFIGRLKRRSREFTNYSTYRPPLWQAITRDTPAFRGDGPPVPRPDSDDPWPADVNLEVLEQALYEAEFVAIVCDQFPQYRDFRTEA